MPTEIEFTGISERPLFGETKYRDRISFILITLISAAFVLVTFGSIFFSSCIHAVYVCLGVCLLLLLGSHLCLAFWYRSGNLEPRFRNMLFYNTAAIICLSICTHLVVSTKNACGKTCDTFHNVDSPDFLSTNDWNYDNPWEFVMKM